jgi:hypothetical protein
VAARPSLERPVPSVLDSPSSLIAPRHAPYHRYVKASAVSAPRKESGKRLAVARRGADAANAADAASLPQPGDTIGDKYSLVRTIGEGGMGVVFEAMHLRLRQRLAIKVVRPDVPEFEEVLARFDREARVAAKLRSIHSARVIDVDVLPNGLPYMVLEYLDGRDLGEELRETGPLPVEEAVDIALQVTDAMAEAHSLGVVHRDLKPSNLFVCRVGGRRVIKVLDFGISKHEGDGERITGSAAYFGTPHYTAPEQLRSASSADGRSDVWSLGVILFELLTGRLPFEGGATSVIAKVVTEAAPRPTQYREDLPRELVRVVMRALQRDPGERFATMGELAEALAPFGPKQSVAAAVAEAPRGRGRLGEVLVADGMLSPEDLERALARQRETGKLLGRVLIEMELITQADLLAALATQHGVIVTPEGPPSRAMQAIHKETAEREALTMNKQERPPAKSSPRLAIGLLVGLPVAAIAAIVLALCMR